MRFHLRQDDRKFIAAHARQCRVGQHHRQHAADLQKDAIARGMAMPVVDGLEPVEIKHQ